MANQNVFTQYFVALLLFLIALPIAPGIANAQGIANERVAAETGSINVTKKTLVPFLETNCLRCHNDEEDNGEFKLPDLAWEIGDEKQAEKWQEVLDVLNSGEMPPKSEPRLDQEELVQNLAILTNTLRDAREMLVDQGTAVPIRRLNRREYINTIRHLFGLNLNAFAVPEDLRSEHFDTLGESQFFDAAAFDRYLDLGTRVAAEGIEWSGRPYAETTVKRTQPEKQKIRRSPPEGYKDLLRVDEGRYLTTGTKYNRSLGIAVGEDPRASYRIRIHGGRAADAHAFRHSVIVQESYGLKGGGSDVLGVMKIRGDIHDPQTEELIISRRILGPDKKATISISESKPKTNDRGFRLHLKALKASSAPALWIDWTEVEGPIYQTRKNVLGSLLQSLPRGGLKKLKTSELRQFLTRFATEAFRRQPPKSSYIDSLVAHYESLREVDGLSEAGALSSCLGVILASPSFLYLEEELTSARERLTPRSFATRLAYFLWSCPPDEELYQLATSEKIFEPKFLQQQVNRMLDDPKADSFFEGFMSQWAQIDRLDGVTVDPKQYPAYSSGLAYSSRREAIEFFKVIVRENLTIANLIESDFVVANALLGEHYELPPQLFTNQFSKVLLPEESPRGGLITQAGFLTMGSDGTRSSPVIRGAMLMDILLNSPPPPPPPNVPELAEASDVPVSNRQIVELHQKQVACASCHRRIDPVGFGLENFDVIGKWRDFEKVGKKKVAIDASAVLASGVKFHSLDELKQMLHSQRHRLAHGFVESLLAYGLGRNNSFLDDGAVKAIVEDTNSKEFRLRELILGVVSSKPFQRK